MPGYKNGIKHNIIWDSINEQLVIRVCDNIRTKSDGIQCNGRQLRIIKRFWNRIIIQLLKFLIDGKPSYVVNEALYILNLCFGGLIANR
jgi:hypothetical protein